MNVGGVNYTASGTLKFDNYRIYNLGSVGFCSVILNRYMFKVSGDSE